MPLTLPTSLPGLHNDTAAIAAEARFAELCRRPLARIYHDPALHAPGLLICPRAGEDRVWPFPAEITDTAALADHLAEHAAAVSELDPEIVCLVLPLGSPSLDEEPGEEFRLAADPGGDYELYALCLGEHAHVTSFGAIADGPGRIGGWQELPGYLPTLAERLRACFPGGAHALPADSFEWAVAETGSLDDDALGRLLQAAAAESAFRVSSEPRLLLSAALAALPSEDGLAAVSAEIAALDERFAAYPYELDPDDPATLVSTEADALVFVCCARLAAAHAADPAETLAAAAAAAPSGAAWQRTRQRLTALRR